MIHKYMSIPLHSQRKTNIAKASYFLIFTKKTLSLKTRANILYGSCKNGTCVALKSSQQLRWHGRSELRVFLISTNSCNNGLWYYEVGWTLRIFRNKLSTTGDIPIDTLTFWWTILRWLFPVVGSIKAIALLRI